MYFSLSEVARGFGTWPIRVSGRGCVPEVTNYSGPSYNLFRGQTRTLWNLSGNRDRRVRLLPRKYTNHVRAIFPFYLLTLVQEKDTSGQVFRVLVYLISSGYERGSVLILKLKSVLVWN